MLPTTILWHNASYTPTPTPPSSDTVLHSDSHTTILRYSPTPNSHTTTLQHSPALILPHHHPPILSYTQCTTLVCCLPSSSDTALPTPTPPSSDTVLPTPTTPYSDTVLHPYSDTTIIRYSPTHSHTTILRYSLTVWLSHWFASYHHHRHSPTLLIRHWFASYHHPLTQCFLHSYSHTTIVWHSPTLLLPLHHPPIQSYTQLSHHHPPTQSYTHTPTPPSSDTVLHSVYRTGLLPTIILRHSPPYSHTAIIQYSPTLAPTPTPPSSDTVQHSYSDIGLLPTTILRRSPSYTPSPTPPSSDTILHSDSHTTILQYIPTLLPRHRFASYHHPLTQSFLHPHHHPPTHFSLLPHHRTPIQSYTSSYSHTTILRNNPPLLLRHWFASNHHPPTQSFLHSYSHTTILQHNPTLWLSHHYPPTQSYTPTATHQAMGT